MLQTNAYAKQKQTQLQNTNCGYQEGWGRRQFRTMGLTNYYV